MNTICLNMIVKNECSTIQRCLESVKRHLHSWVIVDTGSTDGTQDLIQETLNDLPGTLYERPWVNFEHNRNEAMALAKGKGNYLLFIDADESLVCPPDRWLPRLDLDGYIAKFQMRGTSFQRLFLIRNKEGWRWDGVVHEKLLPPPDAQISLIGELYVLCRPRELNRGIAKVLHDAELLEKAHRIDGENARIVFYLAQSYFEGRKYQEAFYYYEKRSKMGGWDQEVYWSLFRMALLQEHHLGADPSRFLSLYIKAYQYRPSRIEALYYLAESLMRRGDLERAYQLFKIAEATPPSDDAVLVEHWMHDRGIPQCLSMLQSRITNQPENNFSILQQAFSRCIREG